MDELTKLFTDSPQAAMVGATVYLILTTRRTDARVEEIAKQIGLAPRSRRSRKWVGIALGAGLAALLVGCVITLTRPDGTVTTLQPSTNAVPILREVGKLAK